ncbi:MAG TPA: hypothetical protein VFL65_00655 [Jatrophihabitans sp.]|nr:hypothetical protein [Jatrophihabitans sp.]
MAHVVSFTVQTPAAARRARRVKQAKIGGAFALAVGAVIAVPSPVWTDVYTGGHDVVQTVDRGVVGGADQLADATGN